MSAISFKRFLAIILVMCLVGSCSEFLSPDASEVSLQINSPADSLFSQVVPLSFWWEADRLAEAYRLQVVSPDFTAPVLILDTLLIDNRLDLDLAEGLYGWRIRAENEGSVSPYVTRTLILDDTPPLPALALSPVDSATVTDPQSLILTWQSQDFPLAGQSFSVSDSVYLYQVLGTTRLPVGRFFRSFGESKQVEVGNILGIQNASYMWEIRSFDLAGNARISPSYYFFLP